jgi:hypothetical protein
MLGPTTPEGMPSGLGWSLFARRYWGSRFLFILIQVMSFYEFSARSFGYPGFNACLAARPGFSQPSTPFIAS